MREGWGAYDEGWVLPSVTLNLNPALYMPLNCTHAIQSLLLPYDVKGGKGSVFMWCVDVRTGVCVCTRDLVQSLGFLPAAADSGGHEIVP